MAALLQAGKRILLPFGDGHRYDLAIDDEGQLKRIQCKTARYEDGALVFNAHSNSRSGQNVNYYGHADIFAAYAPHTGKVYLVPVDEVGDSQVRLRLVPARNGQVRRVRWAKDYELH